MSDQPRLADLAVDDGPGESWHRKAQAEWERASNPRARKPYRPPDLPRWSAPEFVSRALYGRFLHDRDTRVVHDVANATRDCDVDGIVNGTFFHFWSEVLADSRVADDLPCPRCMAP